MSFVQILQPPFISAYDVFPYLDAAGLTITQTGSYVVLRTASENFTTYPTGFRTFISGSGFWGPGSGFTTPNTWFILVSYEQDATGTYGFSGIMPPNYLNYAFSGATASATGTVPFTGLKTYTGLLTSGYTTAPVSPLYGYSVKAASIVNTVFATGNNLAYLSGSYALSAGCITTSSAILTSGFSGLGSGVQFMGNGTTVCSPMLIFTPTGGGTITLPNGTLEVRFIRTNNYLSGTSNNFINDPNYDAGREPMVANWSVGGGTTARTLGRGSGDGTGFNTVSYGTYTIGSVISGGSAGQTATGYITSNTIITNGQWYTASIVSNGFNVSMYLNGVLDATGLVGSATPSFYVFGASKFADMGAANGPAFYGVIDEVRIWDSLRTSGEIAGNWNKTVSPYTGNLAVLFRN